jgi:phosphopantothenate---cysteine ligase (ATP)
MVDYIYFLREIACLISPLGPKNLVYLAAAVSDFYIPEPSMDEHKIQSREKESGLDVHFEPVPKMLSPLVRDWCPGSFTISFKLETREDILEPKALCALEMYGQNMVIANLLKNHSTRVVFYRPNVPAQVIEQPDKSKEIEKLFIPEILVLHENYIAEQSRKDQES